MSARPATRGSMLSNGWWGAALLIATEAALFGCILATYYYLRFKTGQWPPEGIEPPSIALPAALTGALVLTSVPMVLAVRSIRAGRPGTTAALIALATLVQAGYIAVQIILFKQDLSEFSPRETVYGSIYFTMLAADHVHVIAGIFFNIAVLARLALGIRNGINVLALYWHFVNFVTVFVVLTQLSPSL